MENDRIRLTELQLNMVINESVKRSLKEGYNDEYGDGIDNDSDYGGGLPDDKPQMISYTAEKEINKIMDLIDPYLDKLRDIFNDYDCHGNEYNEVCDIIEGFKGLRSYGKRFYKNDIFD